MSFSDPSGSEVTFSPALLLTGRGFSGRDRLFAALRRCVPEGWARPTGVGGIYMFEADGDMLEIAERISRECSEHVGRLVAVFAAVNSELPSVKRAATSVGMKHIRPDDSFVFRIHKHGSQALGEDIQPLEKEIGGAIAGTVEGKYHQKSEVDLENPDVTVSAEILGPITFIGVYRHAWQISNTPDDNQTNSPRRETRSRELGRSGRKSI